MGNYKGTYPPELCATTDGQTFSSPLQSAPTGEMSLSSGNGIATYYANDRWSGYVNTSGSTTAFDAAHGDWTQQTPGNCNCTGTADEVTWVGIGGYGNQSLLQAGTRYYGSRSYAWYEYLHPCSPYGCNISIQPAQSVPYGATVHAYVGWGVTGSGHFDFQVSDDSTGHYYLNGSTGLNSTYYNGSSSEYINERPGNCDTGCFNPLANFGAPMYWSNAQYHTPGGLWQNFTNSSYTDLEIVNDGAWHGSPCSASTHLLAYGIGAYGNSYANYWCRPT